MRSLRDISARHERLLVFTCIGLCMALALWGVALFGAKLVRQQVAAQIDQARARLGIPVEIGRWHVETDGVFFEEVTVGRDGNVVIDRIKATVNWNPFAGDFAGLGSVIIYRARVKADRGQLWGGASLLRSVGQYGSRPPQKSATSPAVRALIEDLFAALPTKKLWIKSGHLTLLAPDGTPQAQLRGVATLVDSSRQRVLFRIARASTAEGLSTRRLRGKMHYSRREKAYQLFVKSSTAKEHTAWALTARAPDTADSLFVKFHARRLPVMVAEVLRPHMGRRPGFFVKGHLQLSRNPAHDWNFDAQVTGRIKHLENSFLAPDTIGPLPWRIRTSGTFRKSSKELTVDSGALFVPVVDETGRTSRRIRLNFDGSIKKRGPHLTDLHWKGNASVPALPCQTLLDGLPRGLAPKLTEFQLKGTTGLSFRLEAPLARPADFSFQKTGGHFDCRVTSAPYTYSVEHLNGPFEIQRDLGRSSPVVRLSVTPESRDFTPIDSTAKEMKLAFVAAEDAGFWRHEGIDFGALEHAARTNLQKGKVAIGGSTITMQTVKNLFLTHERTISRKLQEMFLAWHLESILTKKRILEIYANIIEFGPGIYGITHAANHFFAKHPYDLSLRESAYLASILPSPRTHYRFFCEDGVPDSFRKNVDDLLGRMKNLSNVKPQRIHRALSRKLRFAPSERQSSYQCGRRYSAKQDHTTAR